MKRPGHLLVLGFEGTAPPGELVSFAERFGLGGVILFRRNCPDSATVRDLVERLRSDLARVEPGWRPLVFVDQEGGRVERLSDVPHLPPARELGEQGERDLEESVAAQAAALRAAGIDVNLAPVCDVLQEGESGDIGDRSFGTDAARVGALAAAYVRGTLRGGVIPCAKHFPGLGSAAVNSHLGLPVVEKNWEETVSVDLVPFGSAVEAGVPLVMAAHVIYPRVSSWPASLSGEWLSGILRGDLGFRGAILSDDMEMGALRGLAGPEEAAVRAVRGGCDLLIYSRMLRSEVDPVCIAEALGAELGEEEIRAAERRIEGIRESTVAARS